MKHIIQSEIDKINALRRKPGYINTDNLQKSIHDRVFTIQDIGANYRWLDHWHSKGLLLSNYDIHKWKKFNLIEYVWIKIILELRRFNTSLKTVAKVKEMLDYDYMADAFLKNPEVESEEIISQFAPPDKVLEAKKLLHDPEIYRNIEEMKLNLLELIITDIILQGSCYSVIIASDDEIIPVKYSYLELYSNIPEFKKLINRSFISISITEILRNFILEKELDTSNQKRLVLLTNEETQVLNAIRQDNLKSVIIRYDENKKINLLEEVKVEKVDKSKRLAEIILAGGYQDITIKTQKGEIVYCERKIKRAL